MYYGMIKKYDIADGEGVRVTLFVSGCHNHCRDCFQPETWDFHYGQPYTKETEQEILEALSLDCIAGLTVLGGEPFEEENQETVLSLLKAARRAYPEKNIWCWSGYVYDRDLIPGGRKHTAYTDEMLRLIDVLVDGPFVAEKKNLNLYFRGSENQRVIDMPRTLKEGRVILYHD